MIQNIKRFTQVDVISKSKLTIDIIKTPSIENKVEYECVFEDNNSYVKHKLSDLYAVYQYSKNMGFDIIKDFNSDIQNFLKEEN
jgi:hypothetical protein